MKAARLLAITLLLQARGKMTADELGQVLEVTPRTIYRDIASLEAARVPVVAEPGPEGGYSLPSGYRVDPTQFSGEEAVSLAIGGAILRGLREERLAGTLQQALARIEAVVPPAYRESVRAGRERFLFDTAPWYAGAMPPDAHLPALRSAVLHGRRVRLQYQGRAAARSEEREVDPLGLVCKAGLWYLVGHCHNRNALRTFRLTRILAVESLAAPRGEYPDFDLARYWEQSRARVEARHLFPVVVRLDAACAPDLFHQPLTFRRLRRLDDGSVEAEIDCESIAEAVSFALSFAAHLEVLSPPAVRAAVADAAERIALLHRA
jgi:predicted DNA-binding transcriptional regulator YafY